MAEVGIAYVLTGPDGARAVVGNCDEAKNDAAFVGYLNPENGVTGLLDAAEVRESSIPVPGGDGALSGPSWLGRRSGTINGVVLPNAATSQTVNAAIARLKRATRALHADGTLEWTPTGDIRRFLSFRRAGGQSIQFGGRRPKTFQVSLVSDDPYALSVAEASLVVVPGALGGEIGITNPIINPFASAFGTVAQSFATNQGDAPTWPRFRIDGPIKNPRVVNDATGQSFRLLVTVQAGEHLTVVPKIGAVLLNGEVDRYSALDFAGSEWWQLQPGANTVRLLAQEYSAGAALTIYWRHAWE